MKLQINFEMLDLLKANSEEKWNLLNQVRDVVQSCSKCPNLVISRQLYPYGKPTFGFGNPNSPIFFIGEAPGKWGCGTTGIPFTKDRSGEFFRKILREELGLNYEDVWITNAVKCCPLDNRTPEAEERSNCYPYLVLELSIIQPYVIVPLGFSASKVLFSGVDEFSRIRGRDISSRDHRISGIRSSHYYTTFPLWHPAFILRTPSLEEKYRAEFRMIEKIVNLTMAIAKGEERNPRLNDPELDLIPQQEYKGFGRGLGDDDRDLY